MFAPTDEAFAKLGKDTLADLLKLKPADAAVKSADFPDAAEPKALEAGTDPKALPLPPE